MYSCKIENAIGLMSWLFNLNSNTEFYTCDMYLNSLMYILTVVRKRFIHRINNTDGLLRSTSFVIETANECIGGGQIAHIVQRLIVFLAQEIGKNIDTYCKLMGGEHCSPVKLYDLI